jgi:hypothetical protein
MLHWKVTLLIRSTPPAKVSVSVNSSNKMKREHQSLQVLRIMSYRPPTRHVQSGLAEQILLMKSCANALYQMV